MPTHPVWRMIEAFLELYPDEGWGVAHIVLSDQNLEDHHDQIEALNQARQARGQAPPFRLERLAASDAAPIQITDAEIEELRKRSTGD